TGFTGWGDDRLKTACRRSERDVRAGSKRPRPPHREIPAPVLPTGIYRLLRRKIHDCRYLAADQRFEFIVARDLCGAAAAADLRAEIDGELVGGLASFGERLDRGDGADANVDADKIFVRDGHGSGAFEVSEFTPAL